MAEVSALRKHPCPECGGDAEWSATKKALACPYCGTVLPWSDGENSLGAPIVEHDLEQTLASIPPDQRGLRTEKKSVKCESCQAISIFDPDRAAQRCDFCGSPSIVAVDDHAGEPAAFGDFRHPSPRPTSRLVWQPLVGPDEVATRSDDRHVTRHLSAVLDLRRPRRCRLDC
jgi:ribosomal protein S27E